MSDLHHLKYAASRAAQHAGYLARTFAIYEEIEHVTEEDVRAQLGCSKPDFVRLRLCRQSEQPTADELRKLSAFAGANLDALVRIIRRVQGIEALRQAAEASAQAALLAARERDDKSDKPDSDDGQTD